MKYLEVTFTTHPCNETVNDVVSALAGEIGFESFVECEGGIQAYTKEQLRNMLTDIKLVTIPEKFKGNIDIADIEDIVKKHLEK